MFGRFSTFDPGHQGVASRANNVVFLSALGLGTIDLRTLIVPCINSGKQLGRVAFIIALCSSVSSVGQAEVQAELRDYDGSTQMFVAAMQGEITESDLTALGAAMDSAPSASMKILVIDSQGGDLATAMQIGDLVRNLKVDVVIPKRGVCYSACVFILAAGINKKVKGEVGIHRPYFGTGADPKATAAAIKAIKSEVDLYLEEMNLPPQLAEDMFSVKPADMRLLSDDDLRDYRLNSMDYVESEAQSVASAERHGLSRQAYETFQADLNASCQFVVADASAFKPCAAEVAGRNGVALPAGWLE